MRNNNEDGFVLVEAIAALAVAALAATALMTTLGAANARSDEARIRGLALRQANVLVEEAVAAPNVDALDTRGQFGGTSLVWTRTIEDDGSIYPGIQRIAVEVSWRTLQKKGVTRLEAYRITMPDV